MSCFNLWLALCLCCLTAACKRPDFIRMQPTIEEQPPLLSAVTISDAASSGQLSRGFYELESGAWRWTAPRFTVVLAAPPNASKNGAWLEFRFSLPQVSMASLKRVTLSARVANATLPSETYDTIGDHIYRQEAPASAFRKDVVAVTFTVDKFVTLPNDNREMSLVATAIALEPK